jgi:hypothetical protein
MSVIRSMVGAVAPIQLNHSWIFFPQQVQETYLVLRAAGTTLHMQGILRVVSLGLRGPGRPLNSHLHLVQMLRMRGDLPPVCRYRWPCSMRLRSSAD